MDPSNAATGRRLPPWTFAAAAGLIAAAGILHLMMVDDHLRLARGSGLFFVAVGTAQVAWAAWFLRDPDDRVALAGLAGMAVMPIVLYTATRFIDAPWHHAPEDIDVIGVATTLLELMAVFLLLAHLAPRLEGRHAWGAIGIGVLLAAGSYGMAIAVEENEWLATAELPHVHGGHGGHAMFEIGVRGTSIVGSAGYDGPTSATGILQRCETWYPMETDCHVAILKELMLAKGAVEAFAMFAEVAAADAEANRNAHTVAHELGFYAYQIYGYDIDKTLRNCSFEVFQGCLHGALQLHFMDRASQGLPLTPKIVRGICPAEWTGFEAYACLHGLGHGIVLFTEYNRDRSLELCDALRTGFAITSCQGGVFMENVVAYIGSRQPAAGHAHNVGETEPFYWVDEDDLAYPCNAVGTSYQEQCWLMQTSLILFLNGGDFRQAAAVCDEAGNMRNTCYKSLGRDAGPYTDRDPDRMAGLCSYGDHVGRWYCVEGFAAETVLNYNSPDAGTRLCSQLTQQDQEPCYAEVSRQAANMLDGDGMHRLCDGIPDAYAAYCRSLA